MKQENQLHNKIMERYQGETETCDLSCGSNLQSLDIKTGETILDLGSGRGGDTLAAARLAGSQGRAVGLDLTAEMVLAAREAASEAGIGNAAFLVGDIEALPFGEESFDKVMSNCVINHARDKALVYREIHRVLKPGGWMVVSDAVTKEPLPDHIKEDPESWAQCFGGAVTEDAYLEAIRDAGYGSLEILNRREYIKNGYDFISLTIRAVK